MQVEINGVHLDVGDSLRNHIEGSLGDLKEKYFEHADHAVVFFTKHKHLFKVEVHMNVGRGILLKGTSEAPEPYPAFDGAVTRLATRLKKYKSKLRDHTKRDDMATVALRVAKDYTLRSNDEEELPANSEPLVIAEMATIIEDLTVSDAVMRLELGDLPAVLFINKANGEMNMIYRRHDGNIGWIDTSKARRSPKKEVAQKAKPAAKKPAAKKTEAKKPAVKKAVSKKPSAKTVKKTVKKAVKKVTTKAKTAAKPVKKTAKPTAKKVTKVVKKAVKKPVKKATAKVAKTTKKVAKKAKKR